MLFIHLIYKITFSYKHIKNNSESNAQDILWVEIFECSIKNTLEPQNSASKAEKIYDLNEPADLSNFLSEKLSMIYHSTKDLSFYQILFCIKLNLVQDLTNLPVDYQFNLKSQSYSTTTIPLDHMQWLDYSDETSFYSKLQENSKLPIKLNLDHNTKECRQRQVISEN
jgi:hypothetical protein